jgi:hypothetical protein
MSILSNPLRVVSIPSKFNWTARLLIGCIVLVAAGSKVFALVSGTVSDAPYASSPRLDMAIIEIEVLLGLLLVSGRWEHLAWWFAFVFFVGAACVSGYLALQGVASCPCFGSLHVSPWISLTLDIVIIAMILLWRPALVAAESAAVPARLTFVRGAQVALLFGGLGLLLWSAAPGNSSSTWIFRDALSVEPRLSSIGEGPRGEMRTFALSIRNNTDRPVRVVGGTYNCFCVAIESLPVVIPAGEAREISVSAQITGRDGSFVRKLELYTDAPESPTLEALYEGTVAHLP